MFPVARLALPAATGSLHWFVEKQDGVATRRQLATAGVSRDRVRAETAARRWQTFGRDVVVLHNAVPTHRQRLWIAVLLLDQPVALAGPTAAEEAGLRGFEDEQVHIVVSRACTARLPRWVRLHNSRRFALSDIARWSGPARVRTPRALVDAAAWSARPRRACAILCAGVQQRLTTAGALVAELRAAGHVRHVQSMRDVLGDIGGGGHTLTEIDLGPLARLAGLPTPRRQVLRREHSGRVRYVDAEIDLPDGATLMIEIDGAVHLKPTQWWDDLARQNELVIGGGTMLRFDSVTVRLDPERVVDQLRRMRLAHSR